ncbi:MAG: NfeD family protein [Phycisphaerales bacterium]
MSEPLLWWAFGLLLAAAMILVLELFLPSGGILGVLSGALSIAAVVCFWRVSPAWGMSSLVGLLVLAPLIFAFFVKVWPDTAMGRKMILAEDDQDAVRRALAETEERTKEDALVGLTGKAVTDLRPVGVVLLEGQRVEALAEGAWIESGQQVRVTHAEGTRIKVRAVSNA